MSPSRKVSSIDASYVEVRLLPWMLLGSLLVALVLPLLVWAVDSNGDNLDDTWEAQYGFSTNAYASTNLVGWWQLNGTNNTDNAIDRSGNGINGSLTNFPTNAYGTGLFSNALYFTTNSTVSFAATNSVLNLTNGFTYSAWFQTVSTNTGLPAVVAAWQDSAATGWRVGAATNGVASITFYDGATQQIVEGTGATVNIYDGAWHQVVTTLNTNQVATVYVDGLAEATNSISGWTPGSIGLFTFGATSTNAVNNPFILDEVRLYNRALGPTEISQLPVTYSILNGSGLTVFDDYIEHLNPLDTGSIVSPAFLTSGLAAYYGSSSLTLAKTSGDGQAVSANTFASNALIVHVANSSGTALTNAPITFSIATDSDGLLSETSGGATTGTSLSLTTDGSGNATIYYEAGGDALRNNTIVATAVSQTVIVSVNFLEHCGVQSGLSLWLKADSGIGLDSSNGVATWQDQSLSSNNAQAITSTLTNRSTVLASSLNGKPVIHMTGNYYDQLTIADSSTLRPSSGVTVISVVRPANSTASSSSWVFNRSDNGYGLGLNPSTQLLSGMMTTSSTTQQTVSAGTMYSPGQGYLMADVYDSTASTPTQSFYQSGSLMSSSLTGTLKYNASLMPLYIGSTSLYYYYTGDVAEIVVYNRALSSTELSSVQGYLADKWGVYAPSATWPASYASTVQTLIANNQWTKAQADAYVASATSNPTIPVDMALWLKADTGVNVDGSGNITTWNDQSVYQNNAQTTSSSQTTGRSTVLTNSLNTKPVVHMNGSYSWLSVPDAQSLRPVGPITMISVLRPTSPSGGTNWVLAKGFVPTYGLGVNPSSQALTGTAYNTSYSVKTLTSGLYSPGQPCMAVDVYDGSNETLYQGGQPVTTSAFTGSLNYGSGLAPLYLGYVGSAFYTGDVAEVMVYNRALSSPELSSVQGYLADKWGVYAPSATWPAAYTSAVQTLITNNGWTKAQADAYVASVAANPPIPVDMALWLKADTGVNVDGSGNITTWNDQSVYQNNATSSSLSQTTGRATVLTNSLNTKPVVHMNGSYSWLSIADASSLRPSGAVTLISVVRPAQPTGVNWILGKGFAPTYGIGITPVSEIIDGTMYNTSYSVKTLTSSGLYSPGQPFMMADVYDGTNETLYRSGQSVATSGFTGSLNYGSGPAPLYLGYVGSAYYSGDIAEVIVYNRALSSAELAAVGDYLAIKYCVAEPAPICVPNGGSFSTSTSVSFSGTHASGSIRYTLDGTSPTSSSPAFTGSLTLTQSCPVTAVIFASGIQLSPPSVSQFYINDTGNSGISDSWQMTYFGHLGISPTALSPGGSGLTNLQAYLYGYNPTLYSSNGDGLSDLTNHILGYGPTATDINGYGLTNAQQLADGLDPFDVGVNPAIPSPPAPVVQTPPVITVDLPANAVALP